MTLVCPIPFVGFYRLAGLQSFYGESFEFVLRGLAVTGDPLDVRLDSDACGVRAGTETGFQAGMS
ncbi:MAG TPA: hypothetical protein VIX89_17820 [Bryobacteraceae bacterium]